MQSTICSKLNGQSNLYCSVIHNNKNYRKILNVLACLLVEQVGKKKTKKAKSHVVLETWIPNEPETPLANSWTKRCLSSGEG